MTTRKAVAGLVLLAASTVGCREAKSPGVNGAEAFTFKPVTNQEFARTTTWTRELAVVGTPARRKETFTLAWNGMVLADPQNSGGYVVDETLDSLTLGLNGAEVFRTSRPAGQRVFVRYFLDKDGRVTRFEGTDEAAQAVVTLLGAAGNTKSVRTAVREQIESALVARVQDVVAGLTGKPAQLGATWTESAGASSGPSREPLMEKVYTVAGVEQCPFGECARVDAKLKVDPKVVAAGVQEWVDEVVGEPMVDVKAASYTEQSSLVVDPKTLMPFGAKDTADGEFTFIGPARREVTVTVKNTRAVEHRYVK